MPPRARRNRVPPLGGRVVNVKSEEHWDTITAKSGDRVLIVQLVTPTAVQSKHLKTAFIEASRKPEYSHITFLDIDTTALSELAKKLKAEKIPAYQVWRKGECLDSLFGSYPAVILHLLQRYAGPRPSAAEQEQPPWRDWAKKGLVVAGALLAGVLGTRLVRGMLYSAPVGSLLSDINDQLEVARRQEKLEAKRRGVSKKLRMLRKKIQGLEVQRQSLLKRQAHQQQQQQHASIGISRA